MGGGLTRVRLEDIATCFEGVIPSPLCTCSRDGIPNVTYLSIVHRLDEDHVALSVQFFNKTRRNVLENPYAQVILVAPETMDQYRLDIAFDHTLTHGAIFDDIRSRLEAIASQSGMGHVFALRGVDIYRVLDCQPVVPCASPALVHADVDHLARLGAYSSRLIACRDLDALMSAALEGLSGVYGWEHAFVMVRDEEGKKLYTLASHGFAVSGVGSELSIGEGLIGMAAARRQPVRSTNLGRDRILSRVVRENVSRIGDESRLDREIPLPGLGNAQSQLVAPLIAHDDLIGVLCVQSNTPGQFLASDERALQLLCHHLAASMAMLGFAWAPPTPAPTAHAAMSHICTTGTIATIKYYQSDDSVLIDDEYVIKGVAGRLLHKLIHAFLNEGRQEFTNKELRLDASLKLPDFQDNLEARLVLLRRRLEDRCQFLRLTRTGRGRLHLTVSRPIRLEVHP
jgi:adenylate cyclase